MSFGQSSGLAPAFQTSLLQQKGSLFATRPTIGHYFATRADLEAGAAALFDVLAAGTVKVTIGQVFALKRCGRCAPGPRKPADGRRDGADPLTPAFSPNVADNCASPCQKLAFAQQFGIIHCTGLQSGGSRSRPGLALAPISRWSLDSKSRYDVAMGRLTTHVLDTASGRPAAGLTIELYRIGASPERLKVATTNADGRVDGPLLEGDAFSAGVYELRFHAGDYLRAVNDGLPRPAFLDVVPIRFGVAEAADHYHVPLLLSPYGYSTYRGS